MKKISFLSIALLLFLYATQGFSCSSFCLKTNGQVVMGKSYDWSTNSGVLLTNLRGSRVSIPVGNQPTFSWMAKYGSITFNQYGQFMPNGGMNEAGLAVEVLWLDDTEYLTLAGQKPVNELQWVQYMLDNCATVDEVVAEASTICIMPLFAKLHYFVADSSGNSAVVEFINGAAVVHHGSELTCKAITNDTYSNSKTYFDGQSPVSIKMHNASLNRFSRIAKGLSESGSSGDAVAAGFKILGEVWVKDWTKWNIVYNLTERTISFKSDIAKAIKRVDMREFNFEPSSSPLFSNINGYYSGSINQHFEPFTAAINTQLMLSSVEQVGVPMPTRLVEQVSGYPSMAESVAKAMNERADTLGTLVVEIRGLKVNGGSVSVGLYNSETGFETMKPINGGKVSVQNNMAKMVIYNVPLNREYAINFYHDENGNGKLDMNKLGIPTEAYGFSGSGSRKFAKAKFMLNQKRMVVEIHR